MTSASTPGVPYAGGPKGPKRHRFRWFALCVLAAIVIVIIAVAIGGGGQNNDAAAAAGTTTQAGGATASSQPSHQASASSAAPATADPMTDKQWTASDVQVQHTAYGDSITARITNNASKARSGVFTLTIFDANHHRIGQAQGSADGVRPGQTVTTTFIGDATGQGLPGDPSTYDYQLQTDMTY